MAKKRTYTRPNFIVIYTDDQQYNGVGYTGNDIINTPFIDKLASKSLKFTNANVAFALCSPSRAAMLTGRYNSANGVLQLNSKLNKGEVSVASLLKEAGYSTAMTGKWHIPQKPKQLGFDFFSYMYSNGTYYNRQFFEEGDTLKPAIHCDLYAANKAKEYLNKKAKKDEPFFLYYCAQTPHMNGKLIWDAKGETKAQYDYKDMPVPANHADDLSDKPEYLKKVRNRRQAKKYGYPDSTAIQKHALDYYSVITELDGFVEGLIKEVKSLGLLDNTYIFFMSDNGWMVGDHGFTSKVLPYRPASHVPFFVLGPGIKKNTESNTMVSNIDIAPTMLDLAGVSVPDYMHGKSLKDVLTQKESVVRDIFIYEGVGKYGGSRPNLTAISDDYRLIITYKDETLKEESFRELYHQKKDKWEMTNLASNPEYASVVRKLESDIKKHKIEVLGM
ncbi:sulfatase-like hydrolase/transferase [Saccharicrinis fermentans]|uniref:Arylsulfatase n=1 Tax=Saccharicrinis fermentans DSM 9555 = JCM 21142 TaxID=869213 RepID=W7Y775_9BACT|nr:sulfatase-like hydrolase/transferase [Saccharicrinis fermentans]GAF04092.1 arylsulfatase [Saccharicrinis fermentans DSM 9555 = JCM 21142]